MKCAALIQMAEHAAVEFDWTEEMTVDLRQPVIFFVNPDPAFHSVKDRRFMGRRMEIRVGLEEDFYEAIFVLAELRGYCFRQHFEQLLGLPGILLLCALVFFLLARRVQETLDALVFPFLLVSSNRPSVHRKQTIKVSCAGLNDPLNLLFSGIFDFRLIHPVAVVIGLSLELTSDRFAKKVAGRFRLLAGLALRECRNTENNQECCNIQSGNRRCFSALCQNG